MPLNAVSTVSETVKGMTSPSALMQNQIGADSVRLNTYEVPLSSQPPGISVIAGTSSETTCFRQF